MDHLADITTEDLRRALDAVDEKKPAQRLIAAIAYKHGVAQTELAEWFGVERKTIYNWLTRLERADLDSAVHDDHRPGRPRKLTTAQRERLEEVLQEAPAAVGYGGAPAWTTPLVQQFLSERWDIEYSRPSCRRLMKEAGLRYRPSGVDADEVDAEESEAARLRHVWLPA